jgi:tRNA threonylcarbamoyladenosine modification (KEOPS) complex Cgi121 subunit
MKEKPFTSDKKHHDKPIILSASSDLSIPELLALAAANSGRVVVQLFDPDFICCKEHILLAYLNARSRFSDHTNRAKSAGIEMLLCASLTSQIDEAIKKSGAKSNKSFVLFSNSATAYKKIADNLTKTAEFKISKKEREARIRCLGIAGGQVEDLAQEMAFHATER